MARSAKIKFSNGFTQLEVLVALVIAIILVTMAIHPYRTWQAKTEQRAYLQAFYQGLVFARDTALQQQQTIIVCPSYDHQHCDINWDQDIIVTTEHGELLKVITHSKHKHIIWHCSLGQNDRLVFKDSGATQGQQGTFIVNAGELSIGKITLNHAGRMKLQRL